MSSLEATCLLIVFCWYNTFRVMTKYMQLICIKKNCATVILSYTSMISTMGTMNAAIAPSSDLIQQLLYKVV